jgi:hypothetical protein
MDAEGSAGMTKDLYLTDPTVGRSNLNLISQTAIGPNTMNGLQVTERPQRITSLSDVGPLPDPVVRTDSYQIATSFD